MERNQTGGTPLDAWDGPFDPQTYEAARRILEADRKRVDGEVRQASRKRGRAVIIVAIVWALCSIALGFANADLLLVAEIGWVAVIAWAVFWMMPSLMGRANLDDVYEQYEAQLAKLEQRGIALPQPSSIEDLVAAIDLVSPPEEDAE